MVDITSQQKLQRQKPYELHNSRDLDSLLAEAMRLVGELESKTHQLPIVAANGESECPFAEQLFADKEEAAAKVFEAVRKLESLCQFLDQDISRLRKNLLTIERDMSRLETSDAREGYHGAQRSARKEYERAIDQRQAIVEVLQRARAAQREAAARKYPGRAPRGAIPVPSVPAPLPPAWPEPRRVTGLPPKSPPPIPPPRLPQIPRHPPNGPPPPLLPGPGAPGGPGLY
jgi:hypothetical protein